MIKSYYLRCLLLFSLVLSVLFSSLLTSSRLALASVNIGNSGVSYQVNYQETNGQWSADLSSQGGVEVGYPNREYRVRIRFYLPENIPLNQKVDILFTLNHQASDVRNINFTVLDSNYQTVSSSACSWDSLSVSHNSGYTKSYFGIYGFKCDSQVWVALSFSYYSDSISSPNNSTVGLLVWGIPYFSIVNSSTDATIIEFQNSVHNDFMDLIESGVDNASDIMNNADSNRTLIINNQNSNTQSIINNQNSNTSSIVNSIGWLHSDNESILDGIGDTIDSINEGFTDIGDSISNFFGGFVDFVTDLPSVIINAIEDALSFLFLPDIDDLQELIENSIEDLRERAPLLASLLTIFQNIIDTFNTSTVSDSFTIPSFTIPLPENTTWTFESYTVPLFPSGLDSLLTATRTFMAVITSILLLRIMFFKIFSVIGFSKSDNPTEYKDGDD